MEDLVICLPDETEQPAHSPLGASGAERWMNCVGSVALIRALQAQIDELGIPAEDDPDYRIEGTAQHEAAEYCLKNHLDTWEIVGMTFSGVEITSALADAVQVYLSVCRGIMADAPWYRIEHRVSSPAHPQMYGTADFAALVGPVLPKLMSELDGSLGHRLKVLDYKGGEGIIVDASETPQLPYYGFCVIDQWERETGTVFHPDLPVDLGICQPRAYHEDGEPTHWHSTTVGEIKAWVHDTLIPAMNATAFDSELDAGKWCRFCPAKLVCPMLVGLARAAATYDPKEVVSYSDFNLGQSYRNIQGVKFYIKALEEQIFHRLKAGRTFEGAAKLVAKKSNRVFRSTATVNGKDMPVVEAAKLLFGKDAVTPAEMKSPAELEKVSHEAKEFVKANAYSPFTGETVAGWEDKRVAIKVKTAQEAFGGAVEALLAAE